MPSRHVAKLESSSAKEVEGLNFYRSGMVKSIHNVFTIQLRLIAEADRAGSFGSEKLTESLVCMNTPK